MAEVEQELAGLEMKLANLSPDDAEGRRRLRPRYNELRMDRAHWLREPDQSSPTVTVPLQAFRLSDDCAMVALPGEFFVELARDLEAAAGIPNLLICGYANDSIGYVPTPHAFPLGGYEAGSARFAPDAGPAVVDAAARLVRSLYG
jgi:hypothetical protein